MFFIPYALFEVPSNMVLKLLRPSLWIGILMLAWGTIMTLFGIVQSYAGLTVARAAVCFIPRVRERTLLSSGFPTWGG